MTSPASKRTISPIVSITSCDWVHTSRIHLEKTTSLNASLELTEKSRQLCCDSALTVQSKAQTVTINAWQSSVSIRNDMSASRRAAASSLQRRTKSSAQRREKPIASDKQWHSGTGDIASFVTIKCDWLFMTLNTAGGRWSFDCEFTSATNRCMGAISSTLTCVLCIV